MEIVALRRVQVANTFIIVAAKLTVRHIAVNTEIVAYYHYMVQFLAKVETVWLAVILVIHKVVQCVWGTTVLHVLVILSAHPHVVKIVYVRYLAYVIRYYV